MIVQLSSWDTNTRNNCEARFALTWTDRRTDQRTVAAEKGQGAGTTRTGVTSWEGAVTSWVFVVTSYSDECSEDAMTSRASRGKLLKSERGRGMWCFVVRQDSTCGDLVFRWSGDVIRSSCELRRKVSCSAGMRWTWMEAPVGGDIVWEIDESRGSVPRYWLAVASYIDKSLSLEKSCYKNVLTPPQKLFPYIALSVSQA